MRKWVLKVFDDYVNGTTAVETPEPLDDALTECDRVSVEVVAHSNDPRDWKITLWAPDDGGNGAGG